jgi:hypothetical protein
MANLANTTAFYELLGLQKGDATSQEDIKRAWRKAALRLHPDRNPDGLCVFCVRCDSAAVPCAARFAAAGSPLALAHAQDADMTDSPHARRIVPADAQTRRQRKSSRR